MMTASHLPQVDFGPGRAVWVQGGLIGLLRLVESELVVVAVLRPIQLLDQEHDGVVDNPQHPQTIHAWTRDRARADPAGCAGLEQEAMAATAWCWPATATRRAAAAATSGSCCTGKKPPSAEWAAAELDGTPQALQPRRLGRRLFAVACTDTQQEGVCAGSYLRRRAASGGRWNGPPEPCQSATSRHL